MKKAILTFAMFTMMLILTSFTSNKEIGVGGQATPRNGKEIGVGGQATPRNGKEIGVGGQATPRNG